MSDRNRYGTNEPAFEHFLGDLDRRLLGAKRVRELTLVEVADHLLEHRDDAAERGKRTEVAVEAALDGFGTAHEYAEFQRSALMQRFARLAIVSGAAFAVMMFGMQWIGDGPAKLWTSAAQGLLYGPGLAAWLVFVQPSRRLPSSSEVEGEDFTVGCGPRMRGLTVLMMVVFSAIGLGGLAASLGFAGQESFSPGEGLAVGACSLLLLGMCWGYLTQLQVTGPGILVGPLGGGTLVRWDQVGHLRPRTERWPWMPPFYWGRVLDVEYVDTDETLRSFTIFPDAANASRLTYMVSRRLTES